MKKRNNIIYWVSTVWLCLGMLSTGIVQLIGMHEGQGGADMLAHLGYPLYVLRLLGACKLLGVAVLLLPALPLLKEWAYAGFIFMMSGAVFSHLASGDGAASVLPSVLLLLLTAISWYFRPASKKIATSPVS